MRRRFRARCSVLALALAVSSVAHTRGQQTSPSLAVIKSGTASHLETVERNAVVAGVDAWFIWTTIAVSTPRAFDLAKVSFVSGEVAFPLAGVGRALGGSQPSQFSMVVPARWRDGIVHDPPAAALSQDGIAFVFTPGATPAAMLRISEAPREFSLAFLVPSAVRAGMVKGLGADVGITLSESDEWHPAQSIAIDGRPVPAVNVPAVPRGR